MSSVSSESIYNLIPPQVQAAPKEAIYVSIHHDKAVDETKEGKLPSRSMGASKVQPNDPAHYLVKGTRDKREALAKATYRDALSSSARGNVKRKDPVPDRNNQPAICGPSSIDFIRQNQLEVILAKSKVTTPAERSYRSKTNYGRKPQYMIRMEDKKKQNRLEQLETIRKMEMVARQKTRLIDEEEKRRLLNGLKQEWERVNKEFQMLSLALDEMNKRRKEKLTAQLTMLEKDIALMQKPEVYVRT